VGYVRVRASPLPQGSFGKTPLYFFPHPDGGYGALVGVDLALPPGSYPLKMKVGGRSYFLPWRVKKTPFGVQRLTLPQRMVELRGEILERVKRERRMLKEILSTVNRRSFLKGPLVAPLQGRISSAFGLRRIINGRYRYSHSGVDIAAPAGTPVKACGDGVVVLSRALYLEGNTIIIDHGLGLYSLYLHLQSFVVKEGEEVRAGQVIGKVGSTGRATGPHLHWGVKLMGQRVDPFSLLRLLRGQVFSSPEGK